MSSNNREQPSQIPNKDNEYQTEQTIQRQNDVVGEQREKQISDLPKAALLGQALKDLTFPADKNTIVHHLEQSTKPESSEVLSAIQKLIDKQYLNVSEVTKAAGLTQ